MNPMNSSQSARSISPHLILTALKKRVCPENINTDTRGRVKDVERVSLAKAFFV
jgi:hypothetical protein